MYIFDVSTGKSLWRLCLTDDGRFVRTVHQGEGFAFAGESEEFFLTLNGQYLSGNTPGWQYGGESRAMGPQGEEIVTITLQREGLEVSRVYTVYTGQSAIGTHTVYRNLTAESMTVVDPSIVVLRGAEAAQSYGYMTGGANFTGSLNYKEVELAEGYCRQFDSHDAPEVVEVEGSSGNDMHPVPNGTGIWCELYAFKGNEGHAWIAFDYQGWWLSQLSRVDHETLLKVWCKLNAYSVAPGESMTLPNATVGFAMGDVDDMGNDINAYIYAYKWDYTRAPYFMETTTEIWREAPLTHKVWYLTKEAQQVGSQQIHVDDFWFDAKGNWNALYGDDWGHFSRYRKRLGMDFRIWMPPWQADRLSQLWLEHPEWMLNFHGNWYNWTIDLSIEEAYQWVLHMICEKQKEFGNYMLRVDGNPTCMRNDGSFVSSGGNYDISFKQSENFYRLYKEFKDRNPQSGLNGCSSGGHTMTIESVRYTDIQQITDGQCRHLGTYWATLFNPVDKISNIGGGSMNLNPETQHKSKEDILRIRNGALFRKWGAKVGLAGRGVLVYRPEVQIGDKTFFLQRLSADRTRGMIVTLRGKNPFFGKPEKVYPKGLVADRNYTVESKLGAFAPITRTGAEWMREGICLPKAQADEAIYLNLTDRPGMGTDTQPPTVPGCAVMAKETWLGRDGAMVTWKASQDNGVVAFYEVRKNSVLLVEVAGGLGWFDETYTPGDVYTVRAVDGDGNASDWVTAE